MSDFIQIGNIVRDDLERYEDREWLDAQPDENNVLFVEVADGDASLAREVETLTYTVDELINSEYAGGCYVHVDIDEDGSIASKLEQSGNWEKTKHSALSGYYFQPVA